MVTSLSSFSINEDTTFKKAVFPVTHPQIIMLFFKITDVFKNSIIALLMLPDKIRESVKSLFLKNFLRDR